MPDGNIEDKGVKATSSSLYYSEQRLVVNDRGQRTEKEPTVAAGGRDEETDSKYAGGIQVK
jgi:hypothetical protein